MSVYIATLSTPYRHVYIYIYSLLKKKPLSNCAIVSSTKEDEFSFFLMCDHVCCTYIRLEIMLQLRLALCGCNITVEWTMPTIALNSFSFQWSIVVNDSYCVWEYDGMCIIIVVGYSVCIIIDCYNAVVLYYIFLVYVVRICMVFGSGTFQHLQEETNKKVGPGRPCTESLITIIASSPKALLL